MATEAGRPDWADFRLLGHLGSFTKITEIALIFGQLFHCKSYAVLTKNVFFLGDFWHQLIWSPWTECTFEFPNICKTCVLSPVADAD
jgi:hypothetical protein